MNLHAAPAPAHLPNLADGSEAIVNIDRAICDLARALSETESRCQGTLAGLTERMGDLVRMRGEIIEQEVRRRSEVQR